MSITQLVYASSFAACALCFALLIQSWRLVGVRLLLWMAVAFAFLAVRSAILLVNQAGLVESDLSGVRILAGAGALCALLKGLRMEAR